MSDFLLELGRNPTARKMIKTLGLPVPLPQALKRGKGAWEERPLFDQTFAVHAPSGSALTPFVALTLARAGANPLVDEAGAAFKDPGDAYGRPAAPLAGETATKLDGIVYDATALAEPASLSALYDFFHPLVDRVRASGRVVVIARPPSQMKTPDAAATQRALEGFVRSLAKEVGRRGATAQLLIVDEGAEARVEPVLRFLLSARSAFVSGQPVHVSATVASAGEPALVRPLEGRVALVTGAARGIGEATARRLAEEGAHVVCLDRPADDGPLSQVARAIGGSALLCDVTDPDAPKKIADELEQRHGGVDIVVHNAGVTRDKTLAKMKPEAWAQAVDINLASVARITRALLDGGVLRDGGRIVCLSSVAGIAGNMGQTNYAASKAGIIGYVEALAPTLAKRGIAVNAVAPGFIETRLTLAIPVMVREVGRRLSNVGQGGLPIDVAEVITFLSSPGAAGMSGQILRVCGGALIGK